MNLTHFMDTSVPSESVEVDEETYGYFQRMARICQLAFTIKVPRHNHNHLLDFYHHALHIIYRVITLIRQG